MHHGTVLHCATALHRVIRMAWRSAGMTNPSNARDALTIMIAITVLQAAARLAHGVVLDLIYACDTALTVYLAAACYRLERDDGLFVAIEERMHLPRYAFT